MRAKKSLGQNFLKSRTIIREILAAAEVSEEDLVLEIGPGKGILTEGLLARAKKVVAVEKDDRLINYLKEKFAAEIRNGKLELIHGDVLELNEELGIKNYEYKVVANIPYYITGQILRKFLEAKKQPTSMTLLVQKEVAQRIVAKDKKESILSISVKAYGEPRYVKKVSKKYFSPEPKVDSAILTIKNISRDFFDGLSEEKFFALVRAGFKSKRKKLSNNLKFIKHRVFDRLVNSSVLDSFGNARAEELDLKDWRHLLEYLH